MTSAHGPGDIRIFYKECVSLARADYDVWLVERGESYEKDGVHVIGVGDIPGNRFQRMSKGAKAVYVHALKLNADIYHLHDPELFPYALKLKRLGKKVIFDSHEDVPGQIRDKKWLPKQMRRIVSVAYQAYETHIVRKLDAVVAATPHIANKFNNRASKTVTVNNFPKLDDIIFHTTSFSDRESLVCYAGNISEDRGETLMKKAIKNVPGKLIIAGEHEKKVEENIEYIGKIDRKGINELYGKAVLGLCILRPIENYYYSQPIKMYEYMAAGIPFVCSDFPGWRKVAEESKGGICVDPNNIDEITRAINCLLNDRVKAQMMGKMGHDYVINNCTWDNEEKKLIGLYNGLKASIDE